MHKRYESLGYLINQSARLMQKSMRQQLWDDDVQPAFLPVMLWLSEEDGLTQGELSYRAAIEQPSMAEMLKRMEASGLIRRKPDKNDKRRRTIHLTASGRRRFAAIQKWLESSNTVMQAGIDPAQLEMCFRTLRQLLENLENIVASETSTQVSK